MALEDLTGTKYIDDLNSSNPAAGDNVSEGDDHIRGIKNVLKVTFPSIDGAITATDTELNYVDGVTSAIQTQLNAITANDWVVTARIADDAITSALIADDAITSALIADDAVVTASIADDAITSALIADDAVVAAAIADGAVDTARLGADAVTGAKIADDAIDSEHYVDGSIDTAHLAADAVTGAKIADDAIDSEHYAAGSIDHAHLANSAVDSAKIADGAIDTVHLGDLQVTTAKIAADAITGAKIADDAINSEHYTDGSIDTAHIADDQVTAAKLSNSLGDLSGHGITAVGVDAGDKIGFDNNTKMQFLVNGNEEMRLEADGDLHVDGDVIAFSSTISDATLKYDINPIDHALDKVAQLTGVTYKYLKDGMESAGLLAQDVEKVMPCAVTERSLPLHTGNDEKYKTLNYDNLHALLIESIKELTAKVEKLEKK